MKCSKCGKTVRGDISNMAKHYRKKHPGAMKRRASKVRSMRELHAFGESKLAAVGMVNPATARAFKRERRQIGGYAFCPHCGGFLG